MSAPTYSFKKEEIDEYGVKVETIDYGDISNSTLLKAFGDQMTYNDLEFYARDEEGCGNLVCVYRWFDEKTLQFKAIHNGTEIFQKSFDRLAMGIELFHILNELETEMETREDEEREEHSSLDLTPESPESPVRRSFGGLAGKAPRKKVVTTSDDLEAIKAELMELEMPEPPSSFGKKREEIEETLEAEWLRRNYGQYAVDIVSGAAKEASKTIYEKGITQAHCQIKTCQKPFPPSNEEGKFIANMKLIGFTEPKRQLEGICWVCTECSGLTIDDVPSYSS